MSDAVADIFPTQLISMGEPIGVEFAWPIAHASAVLAEIPSDGVAVLGGDLYSRTDGLWIPIVPGWYADIQSGESWQMYCQRTVTETRAFLAGAARRNHEAWFVLMLARKPSADQLARIHAR
jgi:hypothetical protein